MGNSKRYKDGGAQPTQDPKIELCDKIIEQEIDLKTIISKLGGPVQKEAKAII